MISMINKKYIISILLVVLMTIAIASAVESASAAKYKTIDTGKKTLKEGNSTIISKWNTQSNGKSIKTKWKLYVKTPETRVFVLGSNSLLSFKKIGKKKIVGTFKTYKTMVTSPSTKPVVDKTSLSAKSYYFKKIKPLYINPKKYF